MKKFFAALSSVLFLIQLEAQDINFSQFSELPLLRNPSFAGLYKGDMRLTSAFRSQWGSVTVPYNTMALSAEMKYSMNGNSNDYWNVGLQITHDVAGDSKLSKTQVFPVFTFNKSLSSERDSYLSLGFMGGAVQQRFDQSQLHFSDQFVGGAYSPSNPTKQTFDRSNLIYPDATIGLSYYSVVGKDVRYSLGTSYFHFTKPKVAFNPANDIRLNEKYVFNFDVSFNVGDYNRIVLYGDYFRQGGASQGQGGFLFSHEMSNGEDNSEVILSGGLYNRWNDAIIPVLNLDFHRFGIGLSYDANISKLKEASHSIGGFELTLCYRSLNKTKRSSLEKNRCPGSVR